MLNNRCYLKCVTVTQSKNLACRKKGRYTDMPFVDKTYSLHLATGFAVVVVVVSLYRTKRL